MSMFQLLKNARRQTCMDLSDIALRLIIRVHVVFGHVVSGQEVVSQVESVPTDNKSRPLQDVRVARCGQLVLHFKQKG